ncbi:MAG: hypothetical protein AB1714_06915 [Acidobacteriota bacterium]
MEQMAHGLDPRPSLNSAAVHFKKCIVLSPEYAPAYTNLCGALSNRADYELGHKTDDRAPRRAWYNVNLKGLYP